MGYVTHHAIIVTSWSREAVSDAYSEALRLGAVVTDIVVSRMNGYCSFLVAPDGSKNGWSADEDGDSIRTAFIDWLRAQSYEDGSSFLEWVEVAYGGDYREANVARHAWDGDAKDGAE